MTNRDVTFHATLAPSMRAIHQSLKHGVVNTLSDISVSVTSQEQALAALMMLLSRWFLQWVIRDKANYVGEKCFNCQVQFSYRWVFEPTVSARTVTGDTSSASLSRFSLSQPRCISKVWIVCLLRNTTRIARQWRTGVSRKNIRSRNFSWCLSTTILRTLSALSVAPRLRSICYVSTHVVCMWGCRSSLECLCVHTTPLICVVFPVIKRVRYIILEFASDQGTLCVH